MNWETVGVYGQESKWSEQGRMLSKYTKYLLYVWQCSRDLGRGVEKTGKMILGTSHMVKQWGNCI